MKPSIEQLTTWDRDHMIHPMCMLGQHERGEIPNRIITHGEGVYVTDSSGRRLLDAFAGLWCVNVGYGRSEIADAISAQAHQLAYFNAFFGNSTEASLTLAKMVTDRAPAGMNHVYFGLGGSDANETNIKFAWYYNTILGRPQKKKIIARRRGYHGAGVLSASMTGIDIFHTDFGLPLNIVKHTVEPHYYHRSAAQEHLSEEQFAQFCADELQALIDAEGADTIAAFIAEPVMGSGGIIPAPRGYWELIQPILKKHDILFIVDEVVTGFGRLGAMFGSDFYGLDADFISTAKGITSGYTPLSAALVHDRVWQVLAKGSDRLGPMKHGWTYTAHPVCAAAAIANLKLIDDLGLVANARDTGAYLRACLHEALDDNPIVGNIRGEGLLAAIEIVKDKGRRERFDPSMQLGAAMMNGMLARDVIARPMAQSDAVGVSPPLCLTRAEADTIVAAAKDSVDDLARKLGYL